MTRNARTGHSQPWRPPPSFGALVDAAAAQSARCARGRHDWRPVDPGRVVYVMGVRLTPGDRYCRYCRAVGGLSDNNTETDA